MVNVRENIDIFSKWKLESEFQKLAPGGNISYGECPDLSNNIDAVMDIIKFIYNTNLYAELNSKHDYCQVCGYTGEIEIKGEEGHLYWQCPNCGNTDKTKLNVSRRTCGWTNMSTLNRLNCGEIPITSMSYSGTENGKRERGMS